MNMSLPDSLKSFWPVQYSDFITYLHQRAAQLLGVPVSQVYCWHKWPGNSQKKRDQIVKSIPLVDGNTEVIYNRRHAKGGSPIWCPSFVLYRAAGKPALQYVTAVFQLKANAVDEYGFCFCKKGELYKLSRHFRRSEPSKVPCPILQDGLFESIYRNTLGFFKFVPRMQRDGVKMNRGIVFSGEPGNGKTMLCRWLANEAEELGYETDYISGPQIEAAYSRNEMEDLVSSSQLLFFDDVDVSFFSRREGSGHAGVCCSLLSALDGRQEAEYCVRIFATNEEISDMDPAFLRPGRIDATYLFKAPCAKARRKIIASWNKEAVAHLDLDTLVRQTENWSGAEINAIKNFFMLHYYETNKWDIDRAVKESIESRPIPMEKKHGTGFLQML
jgi:cell division protease FtsH